MRRISRCVLEKIAATIFRTENRELCFPLSAGGTVLHHKTKLSPLDVFRTSDITVDRSLLISKMLLIISRRSPC